MQWQLQCYCPIHATDQTDVLAQSHSLKPSSVHLLSFLLRSRKGTGCCFCKVASFPTLRPLPPERRNAHNYLPGSTSDHRKLELVYLRCKATRRRAQNRPQGWACRSFSDGSFSFTPQIDPASVLISKFYRMSERYPAISQLIAENRIPEFDNLCM